jgi:hydrogenase nickel incorporation protein HypA/HybF
VHELAIIEGMLESVEQALGGPGDAGVDQARVLKVRIEVGRLSCAGPDALRFCFDVCTRGTILEGAVLEIAEIAGRARCQRCGAELTIESYIDVCGCGAMDLRVIAGEELRVKNLELA